jgi:hypothetical protein
MPYRSDDDVLLGDIDNVGMADEPAVDAVETPDRRFEVAVGAFHNFLFAHTSPFSFQRARQEVGSRPPPPGTYRYVGNVIDEAPKKLMRIYITAIAVRI